VIISEEEYHLAHIGTLHKSGRYPWGSGGTENQRNKGFLDYVEDMHKQGLTDTEIAKGIDMTRQELQAKKALYKNEQKQSDIAEVERLAAKAMSNMAIATQMNRNESSIRALRQPGQLEKSQKLMSTVNMLQEQVDNKKMVDVGVGVEHHLLGVSRDKVDKALAILKEKGYTVVPVQVDQLGTDKKTNVRVLATPGTTYRDIKMNMDKIKPLTNYTDDDGLSWSGIVPPIAVHPDRVKVRYASSNPKENGADADGVVYVRRGVDDISLGVSHYSQVRIQVGPDHFLKGMAMYRDDLPAGVDLVFNTDKSDTGNKFDAMKPLKTDKNTGLVDPANPFGAVVRQLHVDDDPKKPLRSAMNIVNDEGQWEKWSRNLSSQMLSKQPHSLAKAQLDDAYDKKKLDLDEITALTNPAVRVKLLKSFADSADSSAVHLKAAALPRQSSHVILPIPSMKPTEIYAPKFNNGERVALIRYPHGGIFEIPELTVNNRNPEARKLLGFGPNAPKDAVGINAKVAERLSGADFDGDTVLVIPNGNRSITTSPPLARLIGFNPKDEYKAYDGMIPMTAHVKGTQMGNISNLITDMTIKGATQAELARAVRHSMVVIDAEKHNLDYKRSAKDHGIQQLKTKYQDAPGYGAATLISRARHRVDVPKYKPRAARDGGPIDKATGKLVFVPTNESYVRTKTNKRTGIVTETVKVNTQKSKALVETSDARTLLSGPDHQGTPIERVYADHSNRLKSLANVARREMVNTKPARISDSAKKAYAGEVKSLNAKLVIALMNAPLERQAQIIGNANFQARKAANTDMEPAELKKIKFMALETARTRTGAKKQRIDITPQEWQAIQAGAISNDKLNKILNNTDLTLIKQYATPKSSVLMTSSKKNKAAGMIARGYTQAEVASALGVSVSTLKTNLA
jgi:DNA-binding CsgD family transcriptional regulator